MKLIFLGPPGAGKGTLASKATDILGIPHISTGGIFRSAIATQTALGLKVKAIIDAGQLVDDNTTIELVQERLTQDDVQNGYILDGFPRTTNQAETLEQFSAVDKVINFNISDSAIIKRLQGRRVCWECGSNFHDVHHRPKVEGVCDHCLGKLGARNDDHPEAIQQRLEVYHAQTAPLVGYYRDKGYIIDLDSSVTADEVLVEFKRLLGL